MKHVAKDGIHLTLDGKYPCLYSSVLDTLSDQAIKSLAGNAMVVKVVDSLLAWALASG